MASTELNRDANSNLGQAEISRKLDVIIEKLQKVERTSAAHSNKGHLQNQESVPHEVNY